MRENQQCIELRTEIERPITTIRLLHDLAGVEVPKMLWRRRRVSDEMGGSGAHTTHPYRRW